MTVKHYYVAKGAAVLGRNQKRFMEGTKVSVGPDKSHDLDPRHAERALRIGYLVASRRELKEALPGVPPQAPIPADQNADAATNVQAAPSADAQAAKVEKTQKEAKAAEEKKGSKAKNPPKKASPYCLDPKDLQGKSLEQLNIMLKERDAEEEPFETIEEGIEFLSQDFKA